MLVRVAPVVALIGCAVGPSDPLLLNSWTVVGCYTLLVWSAAVSTRRDRIGAVERAGYPTEQMRASLGRMWRKLKRVGIVCAILLILRPTLFVRFWISLPWLQRRADAILAQPFQKSPPYIGGMVGLYQVGPTRRCPHGVKLMLENRPGDGGAGFVYVADDRTECSRFSHGLPLGGGWYTSGWLL